MITFLLAISSILCIIYFTMAINRMKGGSKPIVQQVIQKEVRPYAGREFIVAAIRSILSIHNGSMSSTQLETEFNKLANRILLDAMADMLNHNDLDVNLDPDTMLETVTLIAKGMKNAN